MTHIVAISPHLDDAAFSVGGLLAAHAQAGDRITIITCFTGNVARPQGFALACQLDKGLPADDRLYGTAPLRGSGGLRHDRRRVRSICRFWRRRIAATPAPAELFAAAAQTTTSCSVRSRKRSPDVVRELAPDLVLRPLAIGNHVDHWIVRDAAAAVSGALSWSWEDWPYLRRDGSGRPQAGAGPAASMLADADRRTRLRMCAAYASQLGYQFGGLAALERQSAEIAEERLYV